MTAINGSLAQGVLARFGASWRPSPDLAALGLPLWIPVALGFRRGGDRCSAGPARFLGDQLMIVLSVPFCLARARGAARRGAPAAASRRWR